MKGGFNILHALVGREGGVRKEERKGQVGELWDMGGRRVASLTVTYHGLSNGTPLSACAGGIAGVFDVDAGDVSARGGEEGGADPEVGVGT